MECIVIRTVGDLQGVYEFLKQNGATDETLVFASKDAEGNGYDQGFDIGFDPAVRMEVYPYNSDNYVANGAVISYPSDIQSEMLWDEEE